MYRRYYTTLQVHLALPDILSRWVNNTNLEAVSSLSMKFIAAGGASAGLPGLFGTLAAIGYIHLAALEAIRG